jgi:hypothetical protein
MHTNASASQSKTLTCSNVPAIPKTVSSRFVRCSDEGRSEPQDDIPGSNTHRERNLIQLPEVVLDQSLVEAHGHLLIDWLDTLNDADVPASLP